MGRVFSLRAVQSQTIPSEVDFGLVYDMVYKNLDKSPAVIGAVFFGSFRFEMNCRSDLDCFVLYDAGRQTEFLNLCQTMSFKAHRIWHVPLEIISVDSELAKTTFHSISLGLMEHLERAINRNGFLKRNPLPFINQSIHPEEEVRDYLRFKIRRLEKGISILPSMGEEERHRFLQSVLETPIHVARKMVWLAGSLPVDDSKINIIRIYNERFDRESAEILCELVRIDALYTTEIDNQIRGFDPVKYCLAMAEIERVVLQSLEFVRRNALWFSGCYPWAMHKVMHAHLS